MKDKVIELYTTTDLNNKEIAETLNIKYKEVLIILKENNIPKKKGKSKASSKKRVLTKNEKAIIKEMKIELYPNYEIAKILNIKPRTFDEIVRREREVFNYPLPSYKKLAGKVRELIKYYKEVNSVRKVANKYGTDTKTISKILKHHNIEIDLKTKDNHKKSQNIKDFLVHIYRNF